MSNYYEQHLAGKLRAQQAAVDRAAKRLDEEKRKFNRLEAMTRCAGHTAKGQQCGHVQAGLYCTQHRGGTE